MAKVVGEEITDAGVIETELENHRREQRKAKRKGLASIDEKRRLQRIKAKEEKEKRQRAEAEAKIVEELTPIVDLVREAGLAEPLSKVFLSYKKLAVLCRMLEGDLS